MEELFEELMPVAIFIIAGLVGTVLKAAKKAQNGNPYTQAASPARPAAAKPAQPYQPAQPTVTPSVADVPGQVMAPTVHAHLQPDCDTHDAPGSLGVTSTEGKDPCHEDQLTHERTYDEPAKAASGMTFDWSGENMVKAFVMQEVLTRPCHRHAR